MADIFYILATIQILLGIYAISEGLRWLGMARRRLMTPPAFYTPNVAVLCPCKGAEPGLAQNLQTLCEFDYPNYEVFLSVASSSDPAYDVARRFRDRAKPKVHLVVAGLPEGCGEKVNNLRAAMDQVPAEPEVFVFADSDGRPGRHWLRDLVAPLSNANLGAATTMRWVFPGGGGFASAMLAAWNAPISTFPGELKNNFCWGGGTAIRREVFEQAQVREYWRTSVSDDFSMTQALQRAGRPIQFLPECLVPSFLETDFDGLMEFTNRQIIITRVYAPRLWIKAGAVHLYYAATFICGLAALVTQLAGGNPILQVLILMLGPALLAAVRGVLRIVAVGELFPAWRPQLMGQSWVWTILAPVVPFLYCANFFISAFTRKIRWRGIRYELVSPGMTKILTR